MLWNLSLILSFTLTTFVISLIIYPFYIKLLKRIKAWKTIRENTATGEKSEIFAKLHWHKAWTPTMGWWLFLIIMLLMVLFSFIFQKLWRINNYLWDKKETFILLFWFFSMWIIGLIDDILNIMNFWKVKWLSAKWKTIGMICFAFFIAYRFIWRLEIDYINLQPFHESIQLGWIWFLWSIDIGKILFFAITVFSTLFIVNAVNITDGLDWLAWWLNVFVLFLFAVALFLSGKYLACTIIWVCIATLVAFLFFNINPAKVFMWDSWAFCLWGLIVTTAYYLNMSIGIFIPAIVIFSIFIIELCSSGLQMFWKKVFHHKLFPIAPFHHYLEYKWMKEYSIVMNLWLIQVILTISALILLFIQYAEIIEKIQK